VEGCVYGCVLLFIRDFIGSGYKPRLEVLDKLLACLRLQHLPQQERQQHDEQRGMHLQHHQQQHGSGSGSGAGGISSSGNAAASAGQTLDLECLPDDEPCVKTQAILKDLARERLALRAQERPYEVPFDRRAMDALTDAINTGLLPALKVCVLPNIGLSDCWYCNA